MATEIWIWFQEKIRAFFGLIGRALSFVWFRLTGYMRTVSAQRWRQALVAIPILFILYIVFGMALAHRVDDNTDFSPSKANGGSKAVTMVAALVERETKYHDWRANDPFFQPGWWLDNTPNFQRGMIGAISRFTFELRDQVGRMRGSSAVDTDLEKAAGNLAKEPNRWIMDFGTSFLPTTASDVYFREGSEGLYAYNQRLVTGDAVFERRSDNLLSTLDRIALDLGASSAAIDSYIQDNAGGFLPDFGADDLFYQVKGQVYAYHMILKALRDDFGDVIDNRELAPLYDQLMVSLRASARLEPLLVTNGARDGLLANHLSMQGFFLLRARTQLREITNILLK